ncbi:GIY-YIG nuclease family protein [Pelagibacterales bacterium SAG-MED45]|nr:GIY-YIG nuclease family protein [Pelagibacterales bacterium SAG-MED45]
MPHYVYIIKTKKGYKKTYVGYSTNVKNRLLKHNSSKGAKATRGHEWEIIFIKKFSLKSKALSFEYQLKKDRKKRLSIIKGLI